MIRKVILGKFFFLPIGCFSIVKKLYDEFHQPIENALELVGSANYRKTP